MRASVLDQNVKAIGGFEQRQVWVYRRLAPVAEIPIVPQLMREAVLFDRFATSQQQHQHTRNAETRPNRCASPRWLHAGSHVERQFGNFHFHLGINPAIKSCATMSPKQSQNQSFDFLGAGASEPGVAFEEMQSAGAVIVSCPRV